jgi:hypothetical protein
MARVARKSRRHDGRGSSNRAEVTDAQAPFVRKSRRVAKHTATQIAQGCERRRDSWASGSNAPCVFVGKVYRVI